jgi:hypothetical protein
MAKLGVGEGLLARFAAVVLMSCCTAQIHAASRVYAEYPIAGATVGYDDGNRPVQRVITVALVADDNEQDLEKYTQRCLDVRLADVATFVRKQAHDGAPGSPWRSVTSVLTDLALKAERYGRKVTYQNFQDARAARAAEMQRALLREVHKLQNAFAQCGLAPLQPTARPAIVLRECPAPTPVCEQLPADATLSESLRPAPIAVDVMSVMLHAHGALPVNKPLGFGSFVDAARLVQDVAGPAPANTRPLVLAPFVPLRDVYVSVKWPAPPDAATSIKRFEAMVDRLRAMPAAADARMATAVPLILGLSKSQLLQVQDVASEAVATMDLLPEATKTAFTNISDELGRARVIECSRLRGASTAEQVSACAGYKLTEDTLFKCLAGEPCLPVMLDKAYATILDIDQRLNRELLKADPREQVEALLAQADLPRLMGRQPLDAMRKSAKACADQGHKTSEAIALCMSLATMSPADRKVVECLSDPSRLGKQDKLLTDCLAGAVPPALRQQYECVSAPNLTPRALAECAGVPKQSLALLDAATCASQKATKEEAAQCYAQIASGVLGGDAARYGACVSDPRPLEVCLADVLSSTIGLGPEATRIAQCAREHTPEQPEITAACVLAGAAPNSELGRIAATLGPCLANPPTADPKRAAAICAAKGLIGEFGGRSAREVVACAAGGLNAGAAQCAANALAADIEDPLARCVVQGGASLLSMQTCVVAKQLEGKGIADRLMLCALNNGAASAPAAACALGIDPNKREIAAALQCATYSPEPNSFAVCAAGQMVVMVVTDCLDTNFGEGKCFGPNNELQKALSAVGIDLSAGSAGARFIDSSFEIYRQQIYFGKKALKELERAGESVGKALRDVGDALKDVGHAISDGAKKLADKAKDLGEKLDPRNWRL